MCGIDDNAGLAIRTATIRNRGPNGHGFDCSGAQLQRIVRPLDGPLGYPIVVPMSLLSDLVRRHVKSALYIPIETSIQRGPPKELIGHCLSDGAVRRRGWFRWEAAREQRALHSCGVCAKRLFSLLSLERWAKVFLDREPGWT